MRIFVVDGEPLVRRTVTSILEHAGYRVDATDDINVVLKSCREHPPDLVLTNVLLPGITGHEAMRLIHAQCPDVPVLMVSGLPSDPAIQNWIDEDGFDIFPKPFRSATLVAKVEEMISRAHKTPMASHSSAPAGGA